MEIIEELGVNYLIVEDRVAEDEEYLINMLQDNYIPGILQCRKGYRGEEPVLKYDVSGMRTLRQEFQHGLISSSRLTALIDELLSIHKRATDYLMDIRYFVYNPDYMFVDLQSGALQLIYVPYDIPQTVATDYMGKGRYYYLADFLIDRIDHQDDLAVRIGYEFYRMSKEALFSLDKFRVYMRGLAGEKIPKYMQPEESLTEPEENLTWDMAGEAATGKKEHDTRARQGGRRRQGWITSLIERLRNRRKSEEPDTAEVTVDDYWGTVEEDEDDNVTQFFDIREQSIRRISWYENGREKSATITSFPAVLGKQKGDVDLCINDPTVSRHHARLLYRNQDIYIEDLHSKNGTYMDGSRLTPGEEIRLQDNSRLQLGQVYVKVM